MTRATPAFLLALLLPAFAHAADRPAAIQLCFSGLPAEAPLWREAAGRNYRPHGDAFVLDLDVRIDGRAPEKLTKSAATCLRAWLPARNVSSVEVTFGRLDLNLRDVKVATKLPLKADRWHEGPAIAVTVQPFAKVSTALPGSLKLVRIEEAVWSGGSFEWPALDRVSAGRYRLLHKPPPLPRHPCEIVVKVISATGSIRADNAPEKLRAIVAEYEQTIAKKLLADRKESCEGDDVIELGIKLREGIIPNAWTPELRRIAKPRPQPPYRIVIDGAARPFVPEAETLELRPGQTLVVEQEA